MSYYGALTDADDAARQVGWRHRLGQTTRFEAALLPYRAGDRVLDLGAGVGALAAYLKASRPRAGYAGVEQNALMVERSGGVVEAGDIYAAELCRADLVVAIGALVSGEPLDSDALRLVALRRLLARAVSLAERVAAVVVLKQEVLQVRPGIGSDPALAGVRPGEGERIAREVGCHVRVHDDVMVTDRVLYLAHEERDLPDVKRLGEAPYERALTGPWGRSAIPLERARLMLDAGRPAAARDALARAELPECSETRWLADAIALALRAG